LEWAGPCPLCRGKKMAKLAHYEPWNGQDHVYWVMVKLPNWPIMNLGMGTAWPILPPMPVL